MTAENFKKQYFSLHAKLYRIAYTIINNVEDAEDIIQDVYCKLWDEREKLKEIHKPEAYCVTLVKHMCIDFLRSSKIYCTDNIINYDFTDNTTTVEENIVNKETMEQIKFHMNKLPAKQQQVLYLRNFAECSFEEIETITGESTVNIRVLLSRARNTLKMKLKF
jgi:RNA polymerase sigma-70 factor (ECF subfamily)